MSHVTTDRRAAGPHRIQIQRRRQSRSFFDTDRVLSIAVDATANAAYPSKDDGGGGSRGRGNLPEGQGEE